MGAQQFDDERRLLGARFGDLVVFSAYFTNGQAKGKRLPDKLDY